MTKQAKPVVGFAFQEIPLEEAHHAVLAGDGNYAELKETLLEKLPHLAPDKAFAFGLPNGKEVAEELRRGICMSINLTLKHADVHWRVTYSGTKKLFLCIPKADVRTYKKHDPNYTRKSKFNDLDNSEILKLWQEGNNVRAIQQQTQADLERIKYVCYQLHPRKPREKPPTHPGNGKMPDDQATKEMKTILVEASRLFRITPEDIQKGLRRDRVIRKAICVVAVKRNIAPRVVAPYVGISKSGVKFNSQQDSKYGREEISELQAALN